MASRSFPGAACWQHSAMRAEVGKLQIATDSGVLLTARLCGLDRKLVIDAVLLHGLVDRKAAARASTTPRVLLRHAGEMSSLLDCSAETIAADPLAASHCAAELCDAVTLMKGIQSHIVDTQGRAWLCKGGGPGLGGLGSGDVLSGIVGGHLALGADHITALL